MTQINQARIRVFCTAPGTSTFSSLTRMFGSFGIAELVTASLIATNDTVDYCASNGDAFEEGLGTIDASGNIVRTTVTRSRHADGTIDTTKVNFSSGSVVIVCGFGSSRAADLITLAAKAVRADQVQSLSTGEKRQALDNLGFLPSGTTMLFVQASPPTGWTQVTTHNDKALRIVSGTGAGTSGSVNFSTLFGRTSTDTFSLSTANLPPYTPSGSVSAPSISINSGNQGGTTGTTFSFGGANDTPTGRQTITASASAPSFSGSAQGGTSTAFSMGIDMRVKYVDVILASKD